MSNQQSAFAELQSSNLLVVLRFWLIPDSCIIIEFKSKNDTFTPHKLLAHTGRVTIWQSEQPKIKPQQLLNVFVVSRLPSKLLGELARKWGYRFKRKRGRKGFYKTRVVSQDIVLVVCSELPVTPKYAPWLLFADPATEQWRESLLMMANHQMIDLLEEAEKLYPKETVCARRSCANEI